MKPFMKNRILPFISGVIVCLCVIALSGWNSRVYPKYDKTTLHFGQVIEKRKNQSVIAFQVVSKDYKIVNSYGYNMFLVPWEDVKYVKLVPMTEIEYKSTINQFEGVNK